jgi:hypothetical protein
MKNVEIIYRTVADARNALCLDTGYDPFVTGHVPGRCTRASLASLGYLVDATRAAADEARRASRVLTPAEADRLCRPVGTCARGHLWSVDQYGGQCPSCGGSEVYTLECDSGHRWTAPADAGPESDRCPRCGEYAV